MTKTEELLAEINLTLAATLMTTRHLEQRVREHLASCEVCRDNKKSAHEKEER